MKSNHQDAKRKLLSFQGNIHLICNDKELSIASKGFDSAKVLGFDTETKPSYVKGQVFKVALLQLATESDAYLIRLHKITQFQSIVRLFENSEIIKTGVAIHDDLKVLKKTFKFEPKSFVELQNLAKEKGLTRFGLKGMTEEVLQSTLNKGPKMTNWERQTLTDEQLRYAATDAWIGLKIFQKLM